MGKYRRLNQNLEDSIRMSVDSEKFYYFNLAYSITESLSRKERLDVLYVNYIRKLIPVVNVYWGDRYRISTPLRTVISIQSYFLDKYNTFISLDRQTLNDVMQGNTLMLDWEEAILMNKQGECL